MTQATASDGVLVPMSVPVEAVIDLTEEGHRPQVALHLGSGLMMWGQAVTVVEILQDRNKDGSWRKKRSDAGKPRRGGK